MIKKILDQEKIKAYPQLLDYLFKLSRRYGGRFLTPTVAQLNFSQTYLPLHERTPHNLFISLQPNPTILSPFPVHRNENLKLSSLSPSGNIELRVIKGDKQTLYLEIWRGISQVRRKKIDPLIKQVVNDDFFGRPAFSSSEQKIVFIGERPDQKFKTFWSEQEPKPKEEEEKKQEKNQASAKKKEKQATQKFKYEQNFGQTQSHRVRPYLCVYDIANNKLSVLESLPDELYPQHPQFLPENEESLIFSAQILPSFKFGLTFCVNRKTQLFLLNNYVNQENDLKPESLTEGDFVSLVPKFSGDGKWLTYGGRKDQFFSHSTCLQLYKRPLSDLKGKSTTVVEIVRKRSDSFNGLYGEQPLLARRQPLSTNKHELLNSYNASKLLVYFVNVESNEIQELPNGTGKDFKEFQILDCKYDQILIQCSSHILMPQLWLVSSFINNGQLTLDQAKWTPVELSPLSGISDKETLEFAEEVRSILNTVEVKTVKYKDSTATLLLPESKDKLPLLFTIHGGPHGDSYNTFLLSRAMFLLQGYGILMPHYRGSLGYGLDFNDQLLGHIGECDVQDCGELMKTTLEEFKDKIDSSRVAIYGGSHGGFLTAWLLGHPEYNKLFKTGIVLNGVINMSAMVSLTDIPDWVYAECLVKSLHWPPTAEQNAEFFNHSPISVAQNIKVPTYIVVGGSDKRVPPLSSLQLYHTLKAQRTEVSMQWYPEDGHGLRGDETALNYLVNMALWLNKQI